MQNKLPPTDELVTKLSDMLETSYAVILHKVPADAQRDSFLEDIKELLERVRGFDD